MNITVLGAAGFIGTNLIKFLERDINNQILAVDEDLRYFNACGFDDKVKIVERSFSKEAGFVDLLEGQDVVYHLISTNNPTSSNKNIGADIADNVLITIDVLEACVKNGVRKIIFISSGGTVYGDQVPIPIHESCETNPINTYGIQKLTIEKILYLYYRMHKLDYRIVRLANPYGPYQRPNGILGVVTTFIYHALNDGKLTVYGDGTVIRDYIYIDDAIRGICKIADYNGEYKVFNLGSGKGTNINEIIDVICKVVDERVVITYLPGRSVDVPVNVLDITRYLNACGHTSFVGIEEGMRKTIEFLKGS